MQSSFGHTDKPAVLAGAHESSEEGSAPSVVVFRKFDEPRVIYTGDVTDEEALTAFINEQSIPLVTVLDSTPRNRDALRKLFASEYAPGLECGFDRLLQLCILSLVQRRS